MEITVAVLPTQIGKGSGDVAVVVDVIRATTALVTLFEAGCEKVYLGPADCSADTVAALIPGSPFLCAEGDDGSAPAGFEQAPSPVAIAGLDLRGRTAVLATANGTPAALAAQEAGARVVLLGALRNLTALAVCAAQQAAASSGRLTIVCSGRLRNTRVALEDLFCAGALVHRLLALRTNGPIELDDPARVALAVRESYPDPAAALLASATGRRFAEQGHTDDVVFASHVDVTEIVPTLTCDGTDARWPVAVLRATAIRRRTRRTARFAVNSARGGSE